MRTAAWYVCACVAGMMTAFAAMPHAQEQRGARSEDYSVEFGTPAAKLGFLGPQERLHGYSLKELATAWAAWALSAPPEDNPLVLGRCEPSPLNRRIWFLHASLDGQTVTTCQLPRGASFVVMPTLLECSEAEGHGSTEAQLRKCVDQFEDGLVDAEVTFDGRSVDDLSKYVVRTAFDRLPANNLIGPDPTVTMSKGFFLAHEPLARGRHTIRTFAEFSDGFVVGSLIRIVVN